MDASPEFATLFSLLTGSRGEPDQPLDEARAGMAAVMEGFPPPSEATFTPTRIGGRPAVDARMPATREDFAVLYLHGGGYVLGDPEHDRDTLARLADGARARAIGLDYRLAPEHPYPAAVGDALAAYRELIETVPPAQVAIAGLSAGGGLAVALGTALRDEGDPLPAGIVAMSPWTDFTLENRSLELNAGKDWMTLDELQAHVRRYVPDGRDRRAISPAHTDLRGLPAILVQAAGDEVLLDDSRALARAAWRAGVPVTLSVWPRLCHGWQAFASKLPEGRAALEQVGAFLRGHLGERQHWSPHLAGGARRVASAAGG